MPHTNLHQQKRKKNLAVLAIIIAFIAIIWAVTMIRISGAS